MDLDQFMNDEIFRESIVREEELIQKEVLKSVLCSECTVAIKENESSSRLNYVSSSLMTICQVSEFQFRLLVADKTDFNVARYYKLLKSCTMIKIDSQFPYIFENFPNCRKVFGAVV